MRIGAEFNAYQFDPEIFTKITPLSEAFSTCNITVIANQYPQWLSDLNPNIAITTQGVWRLEDGNLDKAYKIHLLIGNKYDFVIHPYDYIIQCKNGRIMVMRQKDFESLFGI